MDSLHGLAAPDDFPTPWYDKVNYLFEASGPADRTTREQIRGGWNDVGFRFLAAARWDDEWRESLADHGTAPPPEHRFRQETALFGFFVSSLSVLESFCYAAFASAALVRPDAFAEIRDPGQQRRITPTLTRDRLATQFPDAPLIARIAELLTSSDYQRIADIRNALVHRSLPPRLHFREFGVPEVRPSMWQLDIHGFEALELSADVTAGPRRWLGTTLGGLVPEMAEFLRTELQVRSLGSDDPTTPP